MFQKLVVAMVLLIVLIGLLNSFSSASPISKSYGYNIDPLSSNEENVFYDNQDDSAKRSQRFAWAVRKF